jgi:long-subunit acyl-CoA synthetase (AMP-forming)
VNSVRAPLADSFQVDSGLRTIADAFLWALENHPDELALTEAAGDLALSWREYGERVAALASGLSGLGVGPGDRVALLMGNRPEFNLIDAASMFLGAIPLSIYPTSASEQIAYIAGHARPAVYVVEAEARSRIEEAGISGPILYVENDDEAHAVLSRIESAAGKPIDLHAQKHRIRPDNVLTLIYTSGTTGPPKAVELTHAALLFTIRATSRVVPLCERGRLISYLPHAHVVDRFASHYLQMATGSTTTTLLDAREVFAATPSVQPTMFFAVPRTWEKLRQSLTAELEAGADLASFGVGVRERLGLQAARWLVTGSTKTDPEMLRFFAALGMPVCENWGMSENCAVGTLNDAIRPRIGTVGKVLPGTELSLAADGEILCRGPHVMRAYRDDPEATAATIDADGWLHTGDLGAFDEDGNLSIIGRKKDIIINSSGKNMSPTNIEASVRNSSPIIGQVCCVGDSRPFNTALIVVDPEAARAAAAVSYDPALGLTLGLAELVSLPEVRAGVRAAVEAANHRLSRVEQIKRYRILPDEWPADGGLVTPTMKLRREAVLERYRDVIEDLYSDDSRSTGKERPHGLEG